VQRRNCPKQSIYVYIFQLLEYFIEEYFDQNPISQLGIIVTKNKRAEKITELGGMILEKLLHDFFHSE